MDCEELIARLVAWAQVRPDIGTVIIVGSRARTNPPADEWSDLDLLCIVDQPERYLSQADWLHEMGTPRASFIERTAGGDWERRVLFEGGLDVDFALAPRRRARRYLRWARLRERWPGAMRLLPRRWARELSGATAGFRELAFRGMRVLVDKDGLGSFLMHIAAEAPVFHAPTLDGYLALVNDFWFHAVWAAKKLRRGELWMARSCSDVYMKQLLLRMIEWHARAAHGWDYDTWHGGRYLEQWADGRIVRDLREAFAHYDEEEVRRALLATMDLFRWVAIETATQLGYAYPRDVDEHSTLLVQGLLSSNGGDPS